MLNNNKSYFKSTNQSTFYMSASQTHQHRSTLSQDYYSDQRSNQRYSTQLQYFKNSINQIINSIQDKSTIYNESILKVGQTNNLLRSHLGQNHTNRGQRPSHTSQSIYVHPIIPQLALSMLIDQTQIYSNYQSRVNELRTGNRQSQNLFTNCQNLYEINIELSRILNEQMKKNSKLSQKRQSLKNQNEKLRQNNSINTNLIQENRKLKETLRHITNNQQSLKNSLIELQELKKQNQRLRISSAYLANKKQPFSN